MNTSDQYLKAIYLIQQIESVGQVPGGSRPVLDLLDQVDRLEILVGRIHADPSG